MKRFLFLFASFLMFYSMSAQNIFNPVVYQAQSYDYSQLGRALKQKEERTNRAYEAYADLSNLIGEMYLQIHHDEESLKWFNENIRSLAQNVLDEIDNDNSGKAYRLAVTYKGEIHSNSELIARVKTSQEYIAIWKQVMDRSDLSYEKKLEWEKKYPYKFVPIKSMYGKIIGGYDWMQVGGPNNTPVIIP